MKKKLVLLVIVAGVVVFHARAVRAQGMAVNATGSTADASAIMDVSSTTQGMLVPRMTSAQRTAIATPATGLLVYQNDGTTGFYYYTGSAWTSLNALSNVTTQGNTFNGASQLVQMNSSTQLPAVSGTNLTNLNGANLTANSVTVGKLPAGATTTTFLRGDGTWATPASGGGGATSILVATLNGSSSTTSITAASSVNVNYNSFSTPASGSFDGTTFTVGADGLYLITASVPSPAAVGAPHGAALLLNGSIFEYGGSTAINVQPANYSGNPSVICVLPLVTGNTLKIAAYCGSTGFSFPTGGTTRLTITRLN